VTKQKKRRVWSAEEKRLICGQARLPGVSVSQVARRYDVNANLVEVNGPYPEVAREI
jgi:transposase